MWIVLFLFSLGMLAFAALVVVLQHKQILLDEAVIAQTELERDTRAKERDEFRSKCIDLTFAQDEANIEITRLKKELAAANDTISKVRFVVEP